MTEFTRLWQDGPYFAQAEHFRLSTDCVLLADFINTSGAEKGIDLGCASGAIALLLLQKSKRLHMSGLEIIPEAVQLARANMAENALQERSSIIQGDIRLHRELYKSGSFDLIAANPPYFPVSRGYVSPNAGRACARAEDCCSLEQLCTAAAFLCRTGGSFSLVHKPERLSEVFCCMSSHAIEPKRLRMVHHRPNCAPNLVLIEGRRGGKPGLKIEAPLFITDAEGNETEEIKRIYHR